MFARNSSPSDREPLSESAGRGPAAGIGWLRPGCGSLPHASVEIRGPVMSGSVLHWLISRRLISRWLVPPSILCSMYALR